ncbi:MAG: DUF202 domain-containing protein [Candidatus Fermentibacteraceae bacterium]|nr:DUF202 domain-containing protein [Candidatus Fermentibacteraceae bacterium]MBN2609458.1 DUF202 domain-containing protein [Candidatus Fermentibacteraceae bacterium]
MANERTLLAYVRTALMLLASGLTLVKILRVDPELRVIGYLLMPLSLVVGMMGYIRNLRIRKQLRKLIRDEK